MKTESSTWFEKNLKYILMTRHFLIAITFTASCLFAGAQTSRIEFGMKGLYPEGTVYDNAGKRFFVSSATTGTIGTVDAAGNYAVFYKDSNLKSTFGMKIDPVKKQLLVCAGDPNYSIYQTPQTFRHQIRVVALDLQTGKLKSDVDLSNLYTGLHFANDLTLDEQGNIYITDSFSPVIYRVDAAGKATVFSTSTLYKGTGIGLNGIAWNKKGFLLLVNGANGNVIKLAVVRNKASEPEIVSIPAFFPGADGIMVDHEDLLVVQNKGINKISRLSSGDSWKTAKVVAGTNGEDRFAYPSTLTRGSDSLYALNAKLNELTDSTQPKSQKFSLQVVDFRPAQ